MFLTSKTRHFCRAFLFLIIFLFACAAINQANLALKTTIIEDTHLTLAGIPFKVEANNSLIFLPLQTYEKKFVEFPFLFIFIISWSKQGIFLLFNTAPTLVFAITLLTQVPVQKFPFLFISIIPWSKALQYLELLTHIF